MKRFEDAYRFGTVPVNGGSFPRFMMGTSPFVGAGYFWDKAYGYHQQFFEQPQNIARLMIEAIHGGCNAFQVMAFTPILKALEMAIERTATEVFVCASVGFTDVRAEMDDLEPFSPQAVVTNGAFTDKNLTGLTRFLSIIREKDPKTMVGICTNTPGAVLDKVSELADVQVIMTPINKNGSYMRPSQEASVAGMAQARRRGKVLIGMQTLAAGELRPDDAFPYVQDKVDAIAVGMASSIELTETFRVARKIFP